LFLAKNEFYTLATPAIALKEITFFLSIPPPFLSIRIKAREEEGVSGAGHRSCGPSPRALNPAGDPDTQRPLDSNQQSEAPLEYWIVAIARSKPGERTLI